MDDGRGEESADVADRGDRKGASAQVFKTGFAVAGLVAETFDFARDIQQVALVGILHDWDNQAGGRGDRDADVVAVMEHDLARLLVERSVDERNLLEGMRDGFREESEVRDLGAL